MPPWILASLFAAGCTLVVPLWVLGMTAGDWRRAFEAWWFFTRMLAIMALPTVLIGGWFILLPA
jgi:hypothetical protein